MYTYLFFSRLALKEKLLTKCVKKALVENKSREESKSQEYLDWNPIVNEYIDNTVHNGLENPIDNGFAHIVDNDIENYVENDTENTIDNVDNLNNGNVECENQNDVVPSKSSNASNCIKSFLDEKKNKIRNKLKNKINQSSLTPSPSVQVPAVEVLQTTETVSVQNYNKPIVFVEGKKIPKTITSIKDANFSKDVFNALENLKIHRPYRIQCYAWPNIMRKNSTVLIGTENTGMN